MAGERGGGLTPTIPSYWLSRANLDDSSIIWFRRATNDENRRFLNFPSSSLCKQLQRTGVTLRNLFSVFHTNEETKRNNIRSWPFFSISRFNKIDELIPIHYFQNFRILEARRVTEHTSPPIKLKLRLYREWFVARTVGTTEVLQQQGVSGLT